MSHKDPSQIIEATKSRYNAVADKFHALRHRMSISDCDQVGSYLMGNDIFYKSLDGSYTTDSKLGSANVLNSMLDDVEKIFSKYRFETVADLDAAKELVDELRQRSDSLPIATLNYRARANIRLNKAEHTINAARGAHPWEDTSTYIDEVLDDLVFAEEQINDAIEQEKAFGVKVGV